MALVGSLPAQMAYAQNSATYNQKCQDVNITKENCGILAYVIDFSRALSVLVGVVVVIMVAYGGVQYSASKDNPQQTAEAKNKIRNALFALVIYIFMVAFIQYLVPGGIF